MKFFNFVFVLQIIAILAVIAFWIVAACVAWHFIAKFW